MEERIAKEVAEKEVESWEAHFGVSLDEATRDKLVRAVRQGRVVFNADAETFRYSLLKPVDLDNGERLEHLDLREPTTREMQDASKGVKEDVDRAIRLIAFVSGKALGVIGRVGLRDTTIAGTLMGFFG